MATTEKSAVGGFDKRRLESVAAEVRMLEAESALTAAASRKGNLALQPKLSFKSFPVSQVSVAVSPDCSYRLLMEAIDGAKKSITAYVLAATVPN